jgi:hypothetical protein
MRDQQHPARPEFAGGLSRRQFFAVVGAFWLYVALSNVLYAYSMRTGIGRVASGGMLFAPWDARLLQHALLLPFLWISYWASLRLQWKPLLAAIPLQITLGCAFAAVAYPAMIMAEMIVAGSRWHHDVMAHPLSSPFYLDPMFLSLWVASFVSFIPAYGFGLALVTGLALYTRAFAIRNCAWRRWNASGAPPAWPRCACNSRRIPSSICCIPSAATSNGTPRPRSPWWCSSPTCCGGC